MDWNETYTRLATNKNDALAWQAIERGVGAWARAHLRGEAWHAIEDVIADTCSSVAVTFDRARGDDTFAGFVYGCYLNERRKALAYLRKMPPTTLSASDLERLVDTHSQNLGSEEQATLWQALAELPPRERAAVSLRHLEGLSAEEIATQLGVSTGNARNLVYKGLQRLRRALISDPSRSAAYSAW